MQDAEYGHKDAEQSHFKSMLCWDRRGTASGPPTTVLARKLLGASLSVAKAPL